MAGAVLPLAGTWQYRPAVDVATMPRIPFPGDIQNGPATLFNGMVAPLAPYALRGIIWYQGESNADRAQQYRRLFPALIQDWRQQFRQPELPFLFVQLAGYQADSVQPAAYAWAELREAQREALRLPRTGLAVALDLGEVADIHPRNKQAVAARLALAARRMAYRETALVAAGPTFQRLTVEGSRLRLHFTAVGGGLALKDTTGAHLQSFAIAGADRRFVWARGRLEGNTLVLWHEAVPVPVAVRYAWGNSPFVNLFNQNGLPAPPFRTDDWPFSTR